MIEQIHLKICYSELGLYEGFSFVQKSSEH